MLQRTICALICSTIPFFAYGETPSLSKLSEPEKSALGLDKLSAEQLQKLDSFICSSKKPPKPKKVSIEATVTDIKETGRFATFSNGLQIEIVSHGRKKSMDWKNGDLVKISEGKKKSWVKLTHVSSGKKVRGKIIAGTLAVETKSVG